MFTVNEALPGIRHIRDAMGVCFTLITGTERGLLFDTGYGTEDVGAFVRTLTDQPVTVLLILVTIIIVLLVFYIKHYYFLENTVQEMYRVYDEMLAKRRSFRNREAEK